mmetsp:Transcript_83362/g.233566  ORF Transcript_83362/g.233566 Transcript_83362/m.233566 type:complete len:130 (+) Transcript_83362:91-480(+)
MLFVAKSAMLACSLLWGAIGAGGASLVRREEPSQPDVMDQRHPTESVAEEGTPPVPESAVDETSPTDPPAPVLESATEEGSVVDSAPPPVLESAMDERHPKASLVGEAKPKKGKKRGKGKTTVVFISKR